jgi:hypothetical protein
VAPSTEKREICGGKSEESGSRVVVYGREDCCLCDEALLEIEKVRASMTFSLHKVDIDTDPELVKKYGHEVPVIEIDGRKAFKFRVSAREFRRRLRRPG